ncbi:unnamed protein product [Mytilus edulis]|uniref:Uncharacterized protein n=1 Tax=Mytilus edulis TaxID=6550 RepID=A0A8S3Q8F6_MYTED|nr:unnamed protein product [Mytilus edulis]
MENEVKMWQLVTDLDKKKRGLALALSLQGKPRKRISFVSDGYYQKGRSSRRNFPRNRADRSTNSSRLKTKMNPVFNGNVSRCKICDSKFHWVKDCPHKQLDVNLTEHESDELNEIVNITLFTSAQEFKPLTVFVAEAYNAAVIDTACSKTVCGSKWLYEFVESLDPGLDQLICNESHVPFKFGDGQTVYSYPESENSSTNQSVKCSIETEKCRLRAAAIIRRKDSKVIVDKFMQIWVGIYGAPELQSISNSFGRNPNMPSSIVNKPPALEAATYNNTEPDHDLVYYESDDEEPHQNDTENDENQENVEESAGESADQDDNHTGSLNGEDSPESEGRDRQERLQLLKKSWYNIEYNQPENMRGDQISIDLRTVNDLKVVNQSDDVNEDVLLSDIDFTEAREQNRIT